MNQTVQNKINQQLGEGAEVIIMHILGIMGVAFLHKVETGWNVRRKGKKIVSAYPRKRVQGDISGVMPGTGRSVLVEVKRRPKSLAHGDLEPHQHESLARHAAAGGVSLVGWVSDRGSFLLPHVIDGWCKGKRLTLERAQELSIQTTADFPAVCATGSPPEAPIPRGVGRLT